MSPVEAAAAFGVGVLLVLGFSYLGGTRRAAAPVRRFRLREVDGGPDDLAEQVPCEGTLVRRIPGPDRPDYWLARLDRPLRWNDGGGRLVDLLVLAARLQGASIDAGFDEVTVGVAFVVDPSLREDAVLTFEKVRYVAVGTIEEMR